MAQSIELSVSQRFEIERFSRAIDATADPEALRDIAKKLLQAWHTQKAATNWVIGQQMGPPPAL
jgi:tryptophan synthase beta subunit